MLLSESYKIRLKQLSGLLPLDEVMDMTAKSAAMNKSSNRFSFSIESMKEAIRQGREIGINFQSKNEKYTMPTTKSRIIWPVAMGTNKKGELVIRGYHITGQSEKKAIETGNRSAEASDEWRLFKAKNIKSMWFTDEPIIYPIPGYKTTDSAMTSIIAKPEPLAIKAFQDASKKNTEDDDIEGAEETLTSL